MATRASCYSALAFGPLRGIAPRQLLFSNAFASLIPRFFVAVWSSMLLGRVPLPMNVMYATPLSTPPLAGSGLIPSFWAVAKEASPMISLGPVSPNTAYCTRPLKITAVTLPPFVVSSPEILKSFGMTTYGVMAAARGWSFRLWNAVSGRYVGSSPGHPPAARPSQSMSMSAFQKIAPLSPQMLMFLVPPSSFAYAWPETTLEQLEILDSNCVAVGSVPPPEVTLVTWNV